MKKLTITEMRVLAKNKRGKCLSKHYKHSHSHLKWTCFSNHIFYISPTNVKSGKWCYICGKKNIKEELTRYIFEKLFMEKFPKIRKVFLEGKELDGFSNKLNIGFEYNGIQHYKERIYVFKNTLKETRYNDVLKRKLCKKLKIFLFEIPYWIPPQKIESFIRKKALKNNIPIKRKNSVNIDSFDIGFYNLSALKKVATLKKGKLISKTYLNARTPLLWKCNKKHLWYASPDNIKNKNSWCPACNKYTTKKYFISGKIFINRYKSDSLY